MWLLILIVLQGLLSYALYHTSRKEYWACCVIVLPTLTLLVPYNTHIMCLYKAFPSTSRVLYTVIHLRHTEFSLQHSQMGIMFNSFYNL